jgi:hypothetical protein
MNDTTKQAVSGFKGLNNVADPLRLSLDWAVQADNVDITQTNALARCEGYTRATTNVAITGAYSTKDFSRLYVIDSGELREMSPNLATYKVLKTGLTAAPVWFDEVNSQVFYTSGTDFGLLTPQGWLPWGVPSPTTTPTGTWTGGALPQGLYQVVCTFVNAQGVESGNGPLMTMEGSGQINLTDIPQLADHTTNVYVTRQNGTVLFLLDEGAGTSTTYNTDGGLGREIPYWGTDVPRGSIVAYFGGQLFCAEPYPQHDYTAIWNSLPLQFHHFDYATEGIAVPGIVQMMKACEKGLVIGTDDKIFLYDGEKLEQLADYGVVYGWHGSTHEDKLFFWTLRGLCSAMPFQNLTEQNVSVAPGSSAGGMVLEKDGMRRYVVALRTGGESYNRR